MLAMTDSESVKNCFSDMDAEEIKEVMRFLIEEGVIDFDDDEEEY